MAKPKLVTDEVIEDLEMNDDDLGVVELDENLDDVPEPELLPEGWYEAEIVSVEKRTSQAGSNYYSTRFVIPTDNFPADYDVDNYPEGKSIYFNMLRVPGPSDKRAKLAIRRFMKNLGLPTDVNKIDPSQWIGRRAKLKVEHDTYEGNTREQIGRNGITQAD